MSVTGLDPVEDFPLIGTVENPAFFHDGRNLFLCYQIAPISGGGNAVLKFQSVHEFALRPLNVEGLREAEYPVRPWSITEVRGSEKTAQKGSVLPRRFWTISFNDQTAEIVFETVELVLQTETVALPQTTLLRFKSSRQAHS